MEMKVSARLGLMCVSLIVLYLVLTGQSSAAIDEGSVAGLWLFDEGEGEEAKDSSMNGNDGELIGKIEWVTGMFGTALEFDNDTGNVVSIPDDDSLDLENWTIAAWVKLENMGNWVAIMTKEEVSVVRNYGLWLEMASQVLGAHIRVDAANYEWCYGTTSISDDEWHHVAGTYDGETMRAYVDGALEKEIAYPIAKDNMPMNDGPLQIGASIHNPEWYIWGIIDDVGLFNVALELDDIKTIMNGLDFLAAEPSAAEPSGKFATTWAMIKAQ
jgi:hypothetical protein